MSEKIRPEKYLSISLDADKTLAIALRAITKGEANIHFNFFKVKERKNDKFPHFENRNGALWIKEKKEETKKDEELIL